MSVSKMIAIKFAQCYQGSRHLALTTVITVKTSIVDSRINQRATTISKGKVKDPE